MISVKIIADSISEEGKRLTTMQLVYPRFIHAEFMTHRVFSRNASSSRAIPVKKMIQMVRDEPAMPIHWGKNQPGMQANEELTGKLLGAAQGAWCLAARSAANFAEEMEQLGLHKQVANRILEPFQHMHVLVTATEWDNFFELRCHEDAQPEIRELAHVMLFKMATSKPKLLKQGEWHLPYVTAEDMAAIRTHLRGGKDGWQAYTDDMKIDLAKKVSAARCCRVSYLKHDGTNPNIEDDLALCERLAGSRPIHASPFEHQATPDSLVYPNGEWGWGLPELHGNFVGWVQYRKQIEQSFK